MTLCQSEEYFQRIAEEKLLTLLAECYLAIPDNRIVLECIEKFIHPKLKVNGFISQKNRFLFKSLKEEVALIFAQKGFITEEAPWFERLKGESELNVYL